MKNITLLLQIVFIATLCGILSSCSSTKSDNFTSQKYTDFKKHKTSISLNKPKGNSLSYIVKGGQTSTIENASEIMIDGSTTASTENILILDKKENLIAKTLTYNTLPSNNETAENTIIVKSEKRDIAKKEWKKKSKPMYDTILLVLLAIFIPPLAVYFVRGIGDAFWINIVLTLLCGLPGIIHALIVVLGEGGGSSRGGDERRTGSN